MPSRFEDEKHWRKRAERMRALAGAMPAPQQSILMTDLAEEYDRLAAEAALTARLCGPLKRQRQSLVLHATRI
jgi:hypothetical protein